MQFLCDIIIAHDRPMRQDGQSRIPTKPSRSLHHIRGSVSHAVSATSLHKVQFINSTTYQSNKTHVSTPTNNQHSIHLKNPHLQNVLLPQHKHPHHLLYPQLQHRLRLLTSTQYYCCPFSSHTIEVDPTRNPCRNGFPRVQDPQSQYIKSANREDLCRHCQEFVPKCSGGGLYTRRGKGRSCR
jgi:hypothetical protein